MFNFVRKEAPPSGGSIKEGCGRIVIAKEGVFKNCPFTETYNRGRNESKVQNRGPLSRPRQKGRRATIDTSERGLYSSREQ